MAVSLSTLCYIEKDGKYLMLHRTVKKNDVNKDKWIGVGGHFEQNESPEECLLREVREETGYHLTSYRYRAIVTFVSGAGETEYMSLFTADDFTGEAIPCSEGELQWVDKEEAVKLNIWEGDKIFFRLLNETDRFFSLKLVYDGKGVLTEAALDGTPLELFDVLTPEGEKTGTIRERGVVHQDGTPHGTAHVWIVRHNDKSGYDVLLQKRSANKDSYPGCYDISSAGHVSAGDTYQETAIRELKEELGVEAEKEELRFVGMHKGYWEDCFLGRPFRNHEISAVYVLERNDPAEDFKLQKEEVEDVLWMDYQECLRQVCRQEIPACICEDEFRMLGEYLGVSRDC